MKPWKVAALSALMLMCIMTWPFVRPLIQSEPAVTATAMGGDFVLTRQDNREVALSSLVGQGAWLTFMHAGCGNPCEAELSHLASQSDAPIVVVSLDPSDTPEAMSQWLGQRPQLVGLTGSAEDIKSIAARYRLPVEFADGTPSYPLRWYQLGARAELIKLWPAGLVLD
ncbi:MAG: SCO family protein [Litorivicinus sp.]